LILIVQSIIELGDKMIGTAEKLGNLSTSAVLVLVCVSMGYYIWRKLKQEEAWRSVHEERVLAEERETEAIRQMAASIVMLRDAHNATTAQLSHLTTIIDERLARRS